MAGSLAGGSESVCARSLCRKDFGDGQSSGLMVMSLAAGGPAANAGIVAGDIVLSVDGVSARRMRNITARLGTDSIGRTIDLRFIRGGLVTSRQAMITERPNS